jgi:hypothetical protein
MRFAPAVLTLCAIVRAASSAADEGLIEINQDRATRGGVSASDDPGFPVTLSRGGSYVLTGNLTTGGPSAIEITADHVTLDLNGFSVVGPNSGTGIGIDAAARNNVVVKNGTVTAMGGTGVEVGTNSRVEGVRSIQNRGRGIRAGDGSVVIGCTASGNLLQGLTLTQKAHASANTSFNNAGDAPRTYLLFPYVTAQAGYDTALTIANTTADVSGLGATPDAGSCTISYFGNSSGGPAPPPQTSLSIPAGETLVFSLVGGGSFGIAATPGFQGYVIADCEFPLAHGRSFIGLFGASPSMSSEAVVIEAGRSVKLPERN